MLFLQQLVLLADRVAAQDLVVASLHADWASFGSWSIQVEQGHGALRAIWDGREQLLAVEVAPAGSGPWARETEQVCRDNADALREVEQHIMRWKERPPS